MKKDKWHRTRKNNCQTNNSAGNTFKCDTCGKPHKTEDCWNGANSANNPRPKHHNQQERKTDNFVQPTTTKTDDVSKKTKYAAPALRGNNRRSTEIGGNNRRNSEKFELFEDLFRNNIKMYPHLREIKKINYIHSLLRGDAPQAFCNIEDSKNDSFDEIMTIFQLRF